MSSSSYFSKQTNQWVEGEMFARSYLKEDDKSTYTDYFFDSEGNIHSETLEHSLVQKTPINTPTFIEELSKTNLIFEFDNRIFISDHVKESFILLKDPPFDDVKISKMAISSFFYSNNVKEKLLEQDLLSNLFNFYEPYFEKISGDTNYKIISGHTRYNKETKKEYPTYLLYKNKERIKEFKNLEEAKTHLMSIEKDTPKENPLQAQIDKLKSTDIRDMRIEDFKHSVSIYEYIKEFHKDFILKKDGKDVRAYRLDKNDKTIKTTNLIISRLEKDGNFYEVYFEAQSFDKTKPKSIIDFVGEFTYNKPFLQGRDFFQAKRKLKNYIESSKFIHIENSSIDIHSTRRALNQANKPVKIDFTLPEQNTFDYLKSRGITKETYLSSQFIGTYGSYSSSEDSKIKVSKAPSFALKKDNKLRTIQWIDVKNPEERGKYFAEDAPRDGALFQSNFSKKTNSGILIESPEKAMAHYQQYHKDMNEQGIEPVYLSSCGQFTSLDLEHTQKILSENNITRLFTAFDNDRMGNIFTANTLLQMNGFTSAVIANMIDDKLLIQFKDQEQENSFMKGLHQTDLRFEFSKKQFKIDLDSLSKLLPEIKIHKSITKDFLDDLNENKRLPYKFADPIQEEEKKKSKGMSM